MILRSSLPLACRVQCTRLVALGVLLIVSGCAAPPRVPSQPLPALVAFLRAAHPDPNRFVSEADLNARLDAEMRALNNGTDAIAVARAASRVLASVGDAHLAVGLGPEVAAGPLLPFLIKRAGERFFIDASEPQLPLGTEVIAVEGRPVADLLDAMAALASVDGDRPELRAAEAERRFSFLALIELGVRASYELLVRRPGGEPETITLKPTDREGVARLTSARQSAPLWGTVLRAGEPPWPTLTRIDETTQLLRLPSFGITDEAQYEARIAALFATLAPKERLVLDLRGNEGGNRALGLAVLRRLLNRPFTQWASVSTRVRAIPKGFRDLISFPIAPESALHGFPGEKRGQVWVVDGDPLAARMVPVENPHPGPVVAFIDDATNSAAIEMLAALLAHREGVQLIGTETQGACDRHTGQLPVVFKSGNLAAFVSLFEIKLVPTPGCQPGRGIAPDIKVIYTEEHFLEGRDPFLFAL